MKFKNIIKKEAGFTLVELIVAVGIFGILSVFVTGAFLNIMSIQKQTESRQQIMSDFRVALDLMGKEILDGAGFPDAEFGVDNLYFQARVRYDMMSKVIQYEVKDDGRIWKAQQDTQGKCQVFAGSFPEECFVPFTSEEIIIEDLLFYINNFDEDEAYGFPIITIIASGKIDLLGVTNPSFRTSVSYSPRIEISPDYIVPTNTIPPEVEIQKIDGFDIDVNNVYETSSSTVNLSGRFRDPGQTGVKTLSLIVRYGDATGEILLPAPDSKSYSESESTDWVSWEFKDVQIYTGNEVSYIKVFATAYSKNVGSDEVYVFSEAPPPPPSSPELTLAFQCSTTSADVDYVKLVINSTDESVNYYEIEKNGVPLDNVDKYDESINFFDFDVSKGNSYTYKVTAVISSWSPEVKSSSVQETITLPSDSCSIPEITYFKNSINCNIKDYSPTIDFTLRSEPWSDRFYYFDILNTVSGDGVHSSDKEPFWYASSTYSWRYENFGGLPSGDYEFEASVCLGEGVDKECSTRTPFTEETPCGSKVLDSRDGNYYETVEIGNQCWFAEDLRYECDNYSPDASTWSQSPPYVTCADQNPGYNGLLYQWNAAMDGSTTEGDQGLCPEGWHIPTDEEIKILEGTVDSIYKVGDPEWDISGETRGYDAGDQLKDPAGGRCVSTPCGESGFNSIVPGSRDADDGALVGNHNIWSSTHWGSLTYGGSAVRRILGTNREIFRNYSGKAGGFSVRCLRDSDDEGMLTVKKIIIEDQTCDPPPSEFWPKSDDSSDHGWYCTVDDFGDPNITVRLSVNKGDAPWYSPFNEYIISERDCGGTDTDWNVVAKTPSNDSYPGKVRVFEGYYDREEACYEYKVQAHNSSSDLFGVPGFHTVDIGECTPGDSFIVETELVCTEDVDSDYREIHVTVLDDVEYGLDVAALFNFYHCTFDALGNYDCEVSPFASFSRFDQQEGTVAVHYGPEDNMFHYYGAEICKYDGSDCSSMVYKAEEVENKACNPMTPEIEEKSIKFASDDVCHDIGVDERDLRLYATADNDSDSVYINIYRGGEKLNTEEGLNQGEVYTDTVLNGSTYTYGFQACYPLAVPECGGIVEQNFTVEENICDPTTPEMISMEVYCNNLGQIKSIRLHPYGSDYYEAYMTEKIIPDSPAFSGITSVDTSWDVYETFDPPIESSVVHKYGSYSYRGELKSDWYYRSIDLDPAIYCEDPFKVGSSESTLVASITATEGSNRSSKQIYLFVDPMNNSFSEPVNFDTDQIKIELQEEMTLLGVTEDDIEFYLNPDVSNYPYDENKLIFFVTIPDKRYLEPEDDPVLGAIIEVFGESQGFKTGKKIPLVIKWESGSQD